MSTGNLLTSLDAIESSYTKRINTGITEINEIFGESCQSNSFGQIIYRECGIPRGKIILIGGEQGVGKTRFYTALSHKLVADFGLRVGVAQAEMSAGEYKELSTQVLGGHGVPLRNQHNFFVGSSQMRNIDDQIRAISSYRPDLWIVDSYQMIHGCNTKAGIEDVVFRLKEVISDHTAVFLISQLNAKGEIKGNNALQYLVDVCAVMKKENPEIGLFSLGIPGKNRSGKSGGKVYLQHRDGLVNIIPHNVVSHYLKDSEKV